MSKQVAAKLLGSRDGLGANFDFSKHHMGKDVVKLSSGKTDAGVAHVLQHAIANDVTLYNANIQSQPVKAFDIQTHLYDAKESGGDDEQDGT